MGRARRQQRKRARACDARAHEHLTARERLSAERERLEAERAQARVLAIKARKAARA